MNEIYSFQLQFDDDNHSLSATNGLGIEQVASLLDSLSKALGHSSKIVLSEIRGNCYALVLSTPNLVTHSTMKLIHSKIRTGDYSGLSSEVRDYASTLKQVMGTSLKLKAIDKGSNEFSLIDQIVIPARKEFYFEINSEAGEIITIGGASLNGKSHIKISKLQYEVDVTPQQERDLIKYFKNDRLLFTLKQKISYETSKVVRAELIDYKVLSRQKFNERAAKFREIHPDPFK